MVGHFTVPNIGFSSLWETNLFVNVLSTERFLWVCGEVVAKEVNKNLGVF